MRTTSGPGLPSGFPFSLASAANGFCFISGMPALGADGTYTAGTFTSEADLAWRNVTNIAEAAGYSARDIVFVQCVLADIGHYGEFNDWWRRRFRRPVRRSGAFHLPGRRAAVRREDRTPGGRPPWPVTPHPPSRRS
ncbi:RidA family protein [Nonomuraea sp. NPDC059007]|uniref:RidA family protein n=1 Tax=Nonomuraea sp. NPDC059007 TaxID=3346692 RepID=UPI0036CDFBAB